MPRQAQDLFGSMPPETPGDTHIALRKLSVPPMLKHGMSNDSNRLLDHLVEVEGMPDLVNVLELAGPPMPLALVRHKLLQIRH